jgi:hypothetical protein
MCPTTLGRVQTRVAILIGPAVFGLLFSLLTGNIGFIVTIGVFLLMGVALDTTLYALVIRWQPPWLTGVLAVGEFVILAVLLNVLQVPLTFTQAALFYWFSWILATLTRIIILPLVSLAWLENGGEFRETGWSIPPALEPLPVIALVEEERPYGALVREFSTIQKIPDEIRNLPSPSGVRRIPTGPPPSS